MLFVKLVIGGLLIFMVFSLFQAMMVMLKNDQNQNMSKYIGRRVLASAVIIGIILIAVATGITICIRKRIALPKPHQQSANTSYRLETQNVLLV